MTRPGACFVLMLAAWSVLVSWFVAPGLTAQGLTEITGAGWQALAHTNGDKLAIDRFNNLHGVYTDGGFIKYATSSDGQNWTPPALVSGSGSVAAYPAIAVDGLRTVAVVYVGNHNPATDLGRIFYAYKPSGSTAWTVSELVTLGTQPDIVASGRTVHITWTTFDRVQYLSFDTQSPPGSPVSFGEEIDVDTCPGNRFLRPSIALVRMPCAPPEPRVAYLVAFDETASGDPACVSLITEVGPRVCRRDAGTASWGLEWSDLVTATNPPGGIEAISLSLNANARDGHLFLAYSDVSDGNARTKIAHGEGSTGTWAATLHDNQKREVHIRAQPNSTAGGFRFAWVGEGIYPGLPYIESFASHRAGTWASGPSPTWGDPTPIQIDLALIGRPQAQWWGRCTGGAYDRIRTYVEAEGLCSSVRLATDFETGVACPPPVGFVPVFPCDHVHAAFTVRLAGVQVIDTRDLGVLRQRGPFFATYDAGDGATATLTWTGGLMVHETEFGFSLEGFQGPLLVEGDGVTPMIVDQGIVTDYDGPFGNTCVPTGFVFVDGFERGDISVWEATVDR